MSLLFVARTMANTPARTASGSVFQAAMKVPHRLTDRRFVEATLKKQLAQHAVTHAQVQHGLVVADVSDKRVFHVLLRGLQVIDDELPKLLGALLSRCFEALLNTGKMQVETGLRQANRLRDTHRRHRSGSWCLTR